MLKAYAICIVLDTSIFFPFGLLYTIIFVWSAMYVPYYWLLINRIKDELHKSIHVNYLPVAVLKIKFIW